MIPGWFEIAHRQFRIDQVVGEYDVWTADLPFAMITVRVTMNPEGDYRATPNVFFCYGGNTEYTGGIGKTIEAAVRDCVDAFYKEIEKAKPVSQVVETDFVWLCWTPFGCTPFID